MSCFCFVSAVLHKCFLFILLKFFLFSFLFSHINASMFPDLFLLFLSFVTKKKKKGINLTFYFLLVFYITFNFMQKQKVVWVTNGIHGRSEENQVDYINYVSVFIKINQLFPQKNVKFNQYFQMVHVTIYKIALWFCILLSKIFPLHILIGHN